MEQNTLIRDTKIADDVFRKIQLGWLEQEFTVYGTAYYKNDTLHYKVSSSSEKIYEYIDEAAVDNIYPANLIRYTERTSLPAGMKEEKTLQVKVELAKKLRSEYPLELFTLCNRIAETVRDDSALSLLEQEQESLVGSFDSTRLACFRELVKYSYKSLRLTEHSYEAFMRWINREYKNLEDDFVAKQTSEGVLYAIMYQENGQTYYVEDALREYVYERKFQAEQKGLITTPIYKQIFWYDYRASFKDARNIYTDRLQNIIRKNYLSQVQTIRTLNRAVLLNEVPTSQLLEMVKREMGQQAFQTAERYFYLWGINGK